MQSVCAQGSSWDWLNVFQQNQVRRGEAVVISQKVPRRPWPKVWIFQKVHADPIEAAAVFADFNFHKQFIPLLLKSEVTLRPQKNKAHVSYIMDLPRFLDDEVYTVENTVTGNIKKHIYDISWTKVRASSSKHIEGSVHFEPMGSETLMIYYNYVVPSSGIARIVKRRSMNQVLEAAKALKMQIERERSDQPNRLKRQLSELKEILNL